MNREFFESLGDRVKEFRSRHSLEGDVRVELWLVSGRAYTFERLVEAGEAFVQVDVTDASQNDETLSLSLPYHQVSQVVFMPARRPRGRNTGFHLDAAES